MKGDGIHVDPATAVTRHGVRLDYGMAVEGLLLQQEQARRDISAETPDRAGRRTE
jgi:hypothetical protein